MMKFYNRFRNGCNHIFFNNTKHIIQALDHYHTAWDKLDAAETVEVKERNIKELDVENMYMEAKLEIMPEVDIEMK